MSESAYARMMTALNKLAKWRAVFAGWQLGTRSDQDPECRAVRDHREVTMLMRAELTAVTRLLVEKGIATQDELCETIKIEAEHLDAAYEARFPGFKTTAFGLSVDPKKAEETTRGWPK